VGESLLAGDPFRPSANDYDWLGPGVYFWESNPMRGLDFAKESARRNGASVRDPFVVGAIIDLGLCLDLTSASGIEWVRASHESLVDLALAARLELPRNSADLLRRNLDCAVIKRLHEILNERRLPPVDTVKGIFTEGAPVYPDAGFREKTHVQIAVRNLQCIKGVFRVTPAGTPRRRS
jgi:hypothetical protein